MFQTPFQLIWRCPKKTFICSDIHQSFRKLSSKSFSNPDVSCRKFEDTEKPCFHQKILREVFLYTCAQRNFAKILGNINIYLNVIGVKPIHPKTFRECKLYLVSDVSLCYYCSLGSCTFPMTSNRNLSTEAFGIVTSYKKENRPKNYGT